jgi:Uma2 family endonuclease
MAGAKARHDRIVVNGLSLLRQLLRGGPCRPYSADFAVRVSANSVRRPDVIVDCGKVEDEQLTSTKPVVVIEVLSRSTRSYDLLRKLGEYQAIESLQHILYVEPDTVAAILHTRGTGAEWSSRHLIGPDTEIPLPALGITLTLSEFYE